MCALPIAAVSLPSLADGSNQFGSSKVSSIPAHPTSPRFIPDFYFKDTETIAHSLHKQNVFSKLIIHGAKISCHEPNFGTEVLPHTEVLHLLDKWDRIRSRLEDQSILIATFLLFLNPSAHRSRHLFKDTQDRSPKYIHTHKHGKSQSMLQV